MRRVWLPQSSSTASMLTVSKMQEKRTPIYMPVSKGYHHECPPKRKNPSQTFYKKRIEKLYMKQMFQTPRLTSLMPRCLAKETQSTSAALPPNWTLSLCSAHTASSSSRDLVTLQLMPVPSMARMMPMARFLSWSLAQFTPARKTAKMMWCCSVPFSATTKAAIARM